MAPLILVSQLLGLPLFPKFKHLPKELRDAIWEYAVMEPRIVPLRRRRLWATADSSSSDEVNAEITDEKTEETAEEGSEETATIDRNEGHWGFKCDVSPPAVLFVNRESYEAVCRSYTPKAFPCTRNNNTSVGETCINFERDTLYLDVDWTLQIHYRGQEMDREERDKVKNLAMICAGVWEPSFAEELAGRECTSENELWLAQFLAYFVNVETVTCVLEHTESTKYEDDLANEDRALAFTDEPLDVNTALEGFESDAPGNTAIPTHSRFMSFDMDLLRQRRSELYGEEEEIVDWPLPNIEQKVMLSAGLKNVLDKKMKELSS
jgi:hypothetical protein